MSPCEAMLFGDKSQGIILNNRKIKNFSKILYLEQNIIIP
jgi:hypothetical protein